MRTLATIAMLSAILAQSPATPPESIKETAKEAFVRLQQQAAAASKAGDQQARLAAILKLRTLLNDAPDAIEASAEAYLAAGDTKQALTALYQFIDQAQADDTIVHGTDTHFTALHDSPVYKSIAQQMARNTTAISLAEPAFTLSDPNILPEDIAYDPHTNTFLITSVLQRKIIRVTLEGKASDFAQPPSHWPMMAIKIDPGRNLLWATEVAVDSFSSIPKEDRGRSAILCFDLTTGTLRKRIAGPPNSALTDMALTPSGDPILSDSQGGILYRLQGDELKPINTTDFISPQTPAVRPDGKQILVPDYVRGIALLNLETSQVTWVRARSLPPSMREIPSPLSGPPAINGIDGLYLDGNTVLLTQNGTYPERVIRLWLGGVPAKTERQQIIERSTPTLGDPTHGVIVGNDFYYIANSGWNHLDDNGNVKPGSPLTPAKIMRFHLR